MIFSWRLVFYTDFGPKTSPLNGMPPYDFLIAYCVFTRILSQVPAIKWNATSHVSPARACVCLCARVCVCACVWVSVCALVGAGWSNTCSFAGGNNPRILHCREKNISLFVHSSRGQSLSGIGLSCPGAIIKWDRPINVVSWRANLVQAYVSSLGRNIDRPIPLNCQSWLW